MDMNAALTELGRLLAQVQEIPAAKDRVTERMDFMVSNLLTYPALFGRLNAGLGIARLPQDAQDEVERLTCRQVMTQADVERVEQILEDHAL